MLRQVTSDVDWQAVSDLQISVGLEDMDYAVYSDFERRRIAVLRRWAEAGNGVGLGLLKVLNWLAHLGYMLKTEWPVIKRLAPIKNIVGAALQELCLSLRRSESHSNMMFSNL